jgi:hypothetical protein
MFVLTSAFGGGVGVDVFFCWRLLFFDGFRELDAASSWLLSVMASSHEQVLNIFI